MTHQGAARSTNAGQLSGPGSASHHRSGRQFVLTAGRYRARVSSVGATLRQLQHDHRNLIVPFDADQVRPEYQGATLAPWPNRIVDGRYTYDGIHYQLPINETDRGHALHGLALWQDFHRLSESNRHVTLTTNLPAQPGYPFQITVTVDFRLGSEGLITTVTGTNFGTTTAPWGTGPHPYLLAGPDSLDSWTLTLPAQQILTVTPDRLIPVGLSDVVSEAAGRYDYRTPRTIGAAHIDHAYTGLESADDGTTTVRVTSKTGSGVTVSWDTTNCPWVQIHTADRPAPARSRFGLAVEPMTCAPDAYNSGRGLVHLNPGQTHQAWWRIAATGDGSYIRRDEHRTPE